MPTTTKHEAKLVPVGRLKPYGKNPRRGDVETIRESLRENGQYRPIVVRKGRRWEVLAGNHTLAAAKAEGWSEVWATFISCDEETARRIVLVDNRANDLAGYDEQALAELIGELPALQGTGYDEDSAARLLAELPGEMPPDVAPPLPRKATTRGGDLFALGEHRLLCGDATSSDAMARLMGDELAQLMWTDPPYGVSYVGKTEEALRIQGDGAEGTEALLADAFAVADGALAPGAAMYVTAPAGPMSVTFGARFMAQGWKLRQTLVWLKDSMVLGRSDYHYRHEPVLLGDKNGGPPVEPDPADLEDHTPILYGYTAHQGRRGRGSDGWWGNNRQTSVLAVDRPKASRDHPTMKPVELIGIALRNSCRRGHLVLDPFAGSGSTLMACEPLGRHARLMEIDPRYCDVIVKRWEQHTGRKAEKVG